MLKHFSGVNDENHENVSRNKLTRNGELYPGPPSMNLQCQLLHRDSLCLSQNTQTVFGRSRVRMLVRRRLRWP